MKIKNQLLITLIVLATVLVIVFGSIFVSDSNAIQTLNLQNSAADVDTKISSLNHISNDYFLFQNDNQLLAWQSAVNAISNITANFNMDQRQTSKVILIQNDLTSTDRLFNQTVAYLQNSPRNQSVRVDPQFQSLWSQLNENILKLSSDSDQLTKVLNDEILQAQTANINLILILLLAFSAFVFTTYFVTYRHTLKSVANLQAGLGIIGGGNLDYSVKSSRSDEIGVLANSVNEMVIHLKNMTEKLKSQERMAAIGQTAGMVGHDLRNPLQTIAGEVYLAKSELQDLPQSSQKTSLLESINEVEQQAMYMDKIVSDLQTFVKPVEVHKETFDVKQFIVNRLSESQIPNTVKTNLQVESGLQLNADQQLTKRVLLNLITNSVQAMPQGGQLNLRAQSVDSKVQITVEDTGVGIADNVRPMIFTPLFTTKSRGQGFGLAVCKRVIEAQGGTITFESNVGQGTRFFVELPQGIK